MPGPLSSKVFWRENFVAATAWSGTQREHGPLTAEYVTTFQPPDLVHFIIHG